MQKPERRGRHWPRNVIITCLSLWSHTVKRLIIGEDLFGEFDKLILIKIKINSHQMK